MASQIGEEEVAIAMLSTPKLCLESSVLADGAIGAVGA
jgi:hypothetical protein